MGKVISSGYHLNWAASGIWFFAALFMVSTWAMSRDASLKYFDGQSGTFMPRFSEPLRVRFLKRSVAITVALAILDFLAHGSGKQTVANCLDLGYGGFEVMTD